MDNLWIFMMENALKMDDLRVFQRFPFYGNPPYHHRSARVFQISTASQALGTAESIRRGRPPGGLCELCQHAEDSEGRVHQVPEVETGRPETSLPMGMIGFKPDSSLADAQVTLGVLHFKSPISLVMFGDPWLGMWGSPMITARSSKGG